VTASKRKIHIPTALTETIEWLQGQRKRIPDDDPEANIFDGAIGALKEFVSATSQPAPGKEEEHD
jgi:hypothetical protein